MVSQKKKDSMIQWLVRFSFVNPDDHLLEFLSNTQRSFQKEKKKLNKQKRKLQSVDTPCIIRTTIVSLQNFLIGSNSLNTETTHIHLIKTCGKYYYSNCPTLIKPFLSYIVQVFTPLQVHLRFLFFSIFCCRKAYNLVRSQTCATFISIFLEVFTLKIRVHINFLFFLFSSKTSIAIKI